MKAGRRSILALLLAGPGLWPAAGRGETAPAQSASPAQPDVAVTLTQRRLYEVEGTFQAPVPRSVAWEVLTDYGNIGDFVPAIKLSRVVERKEGELSVEQDASGGWMFFSRRVVLQLKVREAPPGDIFFEEVSGKDFTVYSGTWKLEEGPGGTSVVYRLRAEPKFGVPGFMMRGALKKGARDLLRGVRGEMARRNGGKPWNGM